MASWICSSTLTRSPPSAVRDDVGAHLVANLRSERLRRVLQLGRDDGIREPAGRRKGGVEHVGKLDVPQIAFGQTTHNAVSSV